MEGPSIVLLKEAVAQFTGEKIISVSGNSKINQNILLNKRVIEFKSWGKHFLICMNELTLKVHFLMFGSYTINERKPDRPIRLNITFKNGEINLYACSLKYLVGDINDYYDWSADVMNDQWDKKKAKAKLKANGDIYICDALLEQEIFAGVGNIIKNEILYRVRVHPESVVGKIPAAKINKLIDETRIYSFQFLDWKRIYELKKHWLAHTKKICLRCNLPIIRKQTGLKNRRSFICSNCQILYN
ncbi:MAG: DNA-formamidopyrimidine glycosylase family protein [Methanococcaceae archaeon]